ncbi:MAG: prepilin-type N-terminal cleavage/methylation domain-containing protein [Clostridium sp.]|nr:prepilin-type N-terminal cleavage/methylation domain-containing protein [Clostridium sp.]
MKKGFTLVELIVVLSLILIISSFSFISLKSFLETKNKIKTKEFLYEIEDMISYGRSYCINNNISGSFVMVENENTQELIFKIENDVIRKEKYDKTLEIYEKNKVYPLSTVINIESDGTITSKTIYLKNKNNEKYKISITPITFLINISKE